MDVVLLQLIGIRTVKKSFIVMMKSINEAAKVLTIGLSNGGRP